MPDIATIRLGVSIERPTAEGRPAGRRRRNDQGGRRHPQAGHRGQGHRHRQRLAGTRLRLSEQRARPKIRGYQLQNTVTVTVRNLDQLGDVLDDGVAAGATTVNGISFDVADRAAAEAQAREAAVADAKAKADTLASGLGVRIPGVASVSEQVVDAGLVRARHLPRPAAVPRTPRRR